MRKTSAGEGRGLGPVPALALGGLLALGVELLLLLLGAAAISHGVLKGDCAQQLTAGACAAGGLLGGTFTCRWWASRRLLAGAGTGLVCFALLMLTSLASGGAPELGAQAAVELAACLLGGALAGLLAGKKKTKKRRGASKR